MLKRRRAYFAILLLWVSLVSAGSVIGFSLSSFLTRNSDHREAGLETLLLLVLVGVFIGLGQWITLNFRLKRIGYWAPATSMGFALGGFISFFIMASVGSLLELDRFYNVWQWVELAVTLFGTGVITGALQWLALGRKLRTSLRWLLVSGASIVIAGGILVFYMLNDSSPGNLSSSILIQLVFGMAFGLLTGIFAEPLILGTDVESS